MKAPVAVLTALAVVTITTVALAFTRNLSGTWRTPQGRVFIVQNGSSVSVMMPSSLRDLGVSNYEGHLTLEFKGEVEGDDGSSNFKFVGASEEIAIHPKRCNSCTPIPDVTCTLSLMLVAQGQVIGQFPGRSLEMSAAGILGPVSCIKNGVKIYDDIIALDMSGGWQ